MHIVMLGLSIFVLQGNATDVDVMGAECYSGTGGICGMEKGKARGDENGGREGGSNDWMRWLEETSCSLAFSTCTGGRLYEKVLLVVMLCSMELS